MPRLRTCGSKANSERSIAASCGVRICAAFSDGSFQSFFIGLSFFITRFIISKRRLFVAFFPLICLFQDGITAKWQKLGRSKHRHRNRCMFLRQHPLFHHPVMQWLLPGKLLRMRRSRCMYLYLLLLALFHPPLCSLLYHGCFFSTISFIAVRG